jgi:hypothetical protein
MRTFALAAAAAMMVVIAAPAPSQASPATRQLTQADQTTDVSAKRRHFRHYGWYRGHHYGWRKHPHFSFRSYGFRSYGYRPYYRHYGRYDDDD